MTKVRHTDRPRPSPECRSLLFEISQYLDDELPAARRRTVERHINSCRCCGSMAERIRTVMAVSRAGRAAPPREVMRRAARRIRALLR